MNRAIRCLLGAAIVSAGSVFGAAAAQAANTPQGTSWSQGGSPVTSSDLGVLTAGSGLTASGTLTLTDTSGKPTGTLTVDLAGSSLFTISADTCTGQRLSKKVTSCQITVQYTAASDTETDDATLTVSGRKVSAALGLSAETVVPDGWNRGGNITNF